MAGGFGWDRWAPWKGFRYTVTEKQKDTTRENQQKKDTKERAQLKRENRDIIKKDTKRDKE